MTAQTDDPFGKFKAAQREAWASFVPVEIITTAPAAKLVKFAAVDKGQRVLDVACGTGVVAVTAARRGAKVSGLDLSPALIERARKNASIAGVEIDFIEGDAEALPYPDGSFDVVLSQFGHIFAPRPAVVVKEMLRVLKAGGRIAFSTWPPEHFTGQMFAFIARHAPPPPPGADAPAPPPLWGDPNVVRDRLGAMVTDLKFARETLVGPALSLAHFRAVAGGDDRPAHQARRVISKRSRQACASARRIRRHGGGHLRRQHGADAVPDVAGDKAVAGSDPGLLRGRSADWCRPPPPAFAAVAIRNFAELSVRHQSKPQCRGAEELDDVAAAPPAGHLRQRSQEAIVAGLALGCALRGRSIAGDNGN